MDRPESTLHHVGYVVSDMDRGIRSFQREGAEVLVEPTVDPVQKVICALVGIEGEVPIELVAPIDPDDSPLAARLRRGGGIDHLCYLVDDVALALEFEEEQGAMIVCEPVPAVTFDRVIGFAHRRSGLLVEYMGRTPIGASS